MKECRKCGQTKPLDEFVRDRQRPDGRYPYCKACHRANVKRYSVEQTEAIRGRDRERRRLRDANKKAREEYLLGTWVYSLKRRHGITVHDYLAMAEAQGNCCAICGETPTPTGTREQGRCLHVDHDHSTGKVRALLCFRCNAGIGHFRENPEYLLSAIAYLAEHAGARVVATTDAAPPNDER